MIKRHKLKIKRMSRRISQTELAKRINISQSHLANIESGRRRPNPELIERIAKELDCSIDDLYEID